MPVRRLSPFLSSMKMGIGWSPRQSMMTQRRHELQNRCSLCWCASSSERVCCAYTYTEVDKFVCNRSTICWQLRSDLNFDASRRVILLDQLSTWSYSPQIPAINGWHEFHEISSHALFTLSWPLARCFSDSVIRRSSYACIFLHFSVISLFVSTLMVIRRSVLITGLSLLCKRKWRFILMSMFRQL